MIARLLGPLLGLALALGAVPCGGARGEPAPAASESGRRILVMLRLAPPHFRAGAGYSGGYGDDQSRGGRRRIAAGIARRHRLALVDSWPMPAIGVDCFIMTVPADRAADAAAEEVSRDAAVAWAQPVAIFRTLGQTGADPLFAAQPTAKAWHLAQLHRFATGRRVRVAVVDSQVDTGHPDLAGQIARWRDFVTGRPTVGEDHGTGIAGVIAARAWNGLGIAGIAPDARLYALRACWQSQRETTVCDTFSLAKAISYAIEQRAEIINLSLSGPSDRLLATLLKVGMARGADVVAAFDPAARGGGFPASLDGVIAVAAMPVDGPRGPYWAPGRDIPTTQPGARWYLVSGSSYAAAEVSGLLALRRERRGADGGSNSLVSARLGGGEINACATLFGDPSACDRPGGLAEAGTRHPR